MEDSNETWSEIETTWENTFIIYPPNNNNTMAKNLIGLLVYQYGTYGASNILTPPVQQGVPVGNRTNLVSTWKGDFSNPLDSSASGVDPSLRYKVYAYVTNVTPSNAGEERLYTNKTVAQILADINS